MGTVNKEKLEEKTKISGWSKIRKATEITSRLKQMGKPSIVVAPLNTQYTVNCTITLAP